jgi:flagellar assembly factor FliW
MGKIKLNTRFGELNIDASQIISFPSGLPGFESNKRWTLFHELDDNGHPVTGVVIHLQSVDDEKLSLPLTEPNLFGFNYEMVLTDAETAEIKLEQPGDALVLMALYKNNAAPQSGDTLPALNIYANLSAPIIINTKSRIGIQKILHGKESKVDFRSAVNL